MATNIENDFPPSPRNDDSEGEDADAQDEEEDEPNDSVARILKQLQSTGALTKKPKQEYHCRDCNTDYQKWEDIESHLLQKHVCLPNLILERLPSDDELPSDDDNWTDDEDAAPPTPQKTPQKIDVSQLLKKPGLQIKRAGDASPAASPNAALSKLSGLGFTIKKSTTPIKEEQIDDKPNVNSNLMQKLGQLGGIKLKLKSDGNNTNTFKVVNGLKDFKTSDDEDSGHEDKNESDHEQFRADGNVANSRKNSESSDSGDRTVTSKIIGNAKAILVTPKIEPIRINKPPPAESPTNKRPVVKQTPKRGANLPAGAPLLLRAAGQGEAEAPTQGQEVSTTSTLRRRTPSTDSTDTVVIKKEVDIEPATPAATPLFSGDIKTERSSPPIEEISTPLISRVKSESDPSPAYNSQPLFNSTPAAATTPLLPVTKTENPGMTIIEINGDSNDEDDDCCVVSATPAPDVKPAVPLLPKSEPLPAYPTVSTASASTAYPLLQSTLTTNEPLLSTEKQHSFGWNAPDTKPPLDMLSRSADDIFDSLLSSAKLEGGSLSDANEYIPLDRLGAQHTCDVCNTRFTDVSLLDQHIRQTGHSRSIVTPTSTLMPYGGLGGQGALMSLLPVVGKLQAIGGGAGAFTHQQNVMINIQAYPGAAGMMPPPQSYPTYQQAPGYSPQPQQAGGEYASGQYPGAAYMNTQQPPAYQQYQQKPPVYVGQPSYQVPVVSSPYQPAVSSPYSVASPLQGMQQAVYAQPGAMNPPASPLGQMGPPQQGGLYATTTSPGGSLRAPGSVASGIRIQNVQTFPGPAGGAAPGTGQLRVAGPNLTGVRPRMPGARGPRPGGPGAPGVRPGLQVQGARAPRPGAPRMPGKRPAGSPGAAPPPHKRRDMLLPGRHDNEDCHVTAMQKQRDGLPLIHSVQGARDKLAAGGQVSVNRKLAPAPAPAPRANSAMASMLASRGISIQKKARSRSPSPERPLPHIPNLGAGVSIKHSSKPNSFSIPESRVGAGAACKYCRKSFPNQSSLSLHVASAHPQTKLPVFKCDECPASYPKSLQLQHHKRTFHNVTGPNRELGLPVVDISQPDVLQRLSGLGIYSYIPLAAREQGGGCFGVPVISVQNMQQGITTGLHALGAEGLLSLGPLKSLPES